MPWTRRQVKLLLSKASPLSSAQKKKMVGELHQDPSLGHAKKGNRERQLVGLVAFGKTNRVIASELHLSEGTIKEYLSRIFHKLSIHTRTELALFAYGVLPDSHARMAAAGKGEVFLQVLGEQDHCKEMALERAK